MFEEKKSRSIVWWGAAFASVIFFFNPNIGIIDFLPDFIGYILLTLAISKLAAIDDRISDAHVLFIRAIYITLVRSLSLFVVFGFVPPSDKSMALLLFSFVFDVLELITIIPAIVKLFDGIIYIGSRHSGENVFNPVKRMARKNDSGKNITEKLRATALFFAVYKAVCGTLPEFTSMTGQGWDESRWASLYQYTGLFRFFGIAFSLIGGVIFLSRALKYIKCLKNDRKFFETMTDVYAVEILSRDDYLSRKAVMASFGYFGVASVLVLDFTIDNFNIIPDVLSALCLLAGLLVIKKYITNWKITAIYTSFFAVLSTINTVLEYRFSSNYLLDAISIDPETFNAYIAVCSSTVISKVCFVLCIIMFVNKTMKEIVEKHTGFSMTTNDSYDPSAKIKQLHKELNRRLKWLIVLSVMSALITIISKIFVTTLGGLWVLGMVVTVAYAVVTITTLAEIKTQIDYKYMLS